MLRHITRVTFDLGHISTYVLSWNLAAVYVDTRSQIHTKPEFIELDLSRQEAITEAATWSLVSGSIIFKNILWRRGAF